MEEETSLTRWLGKAAQPTVASLMNTWQGRQLIKELEAGRPKTPAAWGHLVVACARCESAPLLAALLRQAPDDAFEDFRLAWSSQLAIIDDCFALIADKVWLPQIGSLKSLQIQNVALSSFAVGRLAGLIRESTVLQTLSVVNCNLSADHAEELWVAMLQSRCPLRTLDFSSNSIPSILARAAALGKFPRTLRHLRIAFADLLAEDAWELAQVLASMQNLESLDLRGSPIGDRSGAALLRAATKLPALKALNLRRCALATDSADAFVNLVAKGNALETLDLALNDFADVREGLGTAMQGNHRLRSLDLSQTGLTAVRASELLRGLGQPRCALETLNLSGNRLTALDARGLTRNTSLQTLDLYGTELAVAAYESLSEVLRLHPTLGWLNLDMASGDDASMGHLAEGVAQSSSLTMMNMRGDHGLSANQVAALAGAVKRNRKLSSLYVPCALADDPELQSMFEEALKSNLSLVDLSGPDFEWLAGTDAPGQIDRYLIRNERAQDPRWLEALHKVVQKCMLLGVPRLVEDAAGEIARALLDFRRDKSVEALRTAVRIRAVARWMALEPMPTPRV